MPAGRLLAILVAALLTTVGCSSTEPDLVPVPESASGVEPTPLATDPTAATPDATQAPTAAAAESDAGDGGDEVATPTTTATAAPDRSPTAEALPPPTPTATATPEPEPAAPPSEGCTEGLTGDPRLVADARADVDGDGAGDQITTYRTGPDDGDPWRIRVDTASGASYDSPLDLSVIPGGEIQPLGAADADGDPTSREIFTLVGAGATTLIVAVHAVVGCELEQLTIAGAPVAFPVGGGVANIGGLECVDRDGDGATDLLVAWSGLAEDVEAGRFAIDGVEYRVEGRELIQVGTRSLEAGLDEADFVYAQLTCGTVTL